MCPVSLLPAFSSWARIGWIVGAPLAFHNVKVLDHNECVDTNQFYSAYEVLGLHMEVIK